MFAPRSPPFKTVGYGVPSLRDFEQHKNRTPPIDIASNFLRDRLSSRATLQFRYGKIAVRGFALGGIVVGVALEAA